MKRYKLFVDITLNSKVYNPHTIINTLVEVVIHLYSTCICHYTCVCTLKLTVIQMDIHIHVHVLLLYLILCFPDCCLDQHDAD